ncbi:hypothetical protein Dimus_025832 [Dionaea muscipula]
MMHHLPQPNHREIEDLGPNRTKSKPKSTLYQNRTKSKHKSNPNIHIFFDLLLGCCLKWGISHAESHSRFGHTLNQCSHVLNIFEGCLHLSRDDFLISYH